MPFSGKATYSAGATLPEAAEDVSDLVSIASPHDTPLLDALGDPARPARSTIHEWVEDELLPNTDLINDATFADPAVDTSFVVDHADRFRVGDQVRLDGAAEVMLVTGVNTGTNTLTVVRGYGGSTAGALANNGGLTIVGNAALEGADADSARFTSRSRQTNYTQIFSATVEVSGSELAVRQVGVADELDYQKQNRLRELLRDLETSVINGRAPAATPEGSSTVRRSMRGLVGSITTNRFVPNVGGFPADTELTEEQLNAALREMWKVSGSRVDLIVCNGQEKRWINSFIGAARRFAADTHTFTNLVAAYESDYGVCRVVVSRAMPAGAILLLDSSRVDVLPLAGRHFHYKALATTGDREAGQVIGEYTLEVRNETAHGIITGLTG
ncbi:MAG: DUF5309 family protein [Phycisphaerae bacterium]